MRNPVPVFFLLLLLVPSYVWGQQPRLDKVTIASGGHIVHFMPLDLAVAKGFFAEEGLDPEITQLNGGTATAQALLAGGADFSMNSIDHAFKAAVQGKDNLRMVALLNRLPGMVLVVDSRLRSKVKSISDLKGMALGVTSKGSATHMVLASLLSRSGIDPAAANIVDAGSATFPPALENRQIAGGIALEPFASILAEQGKVFVLADLNTLKDTERFLGGPYNQAGVMTRQDVIDRQPGLVQKVVNVHIRALKWIQEHTPQEIADALPREVVGTEKDRYIKTLKKLREFYSPDGIINPQGVENVYRSMVASGAIPVGGSPILENFYKNDFAENSKTPNTVETKSITNSDGSKSKTVNIEGLGGPMISSLISLLVGWSIAFYFYKKQEKKEQARHQDQVKEIRQGGLYPLIGLDAFEDKICDAIQTANTSIQICMSTPLLHSLKENWIKYGAHQLSAHSSDHWARKFCEPLRTKLRERHEVGHTMRVEMIYLDDKVLNKFVSEVPNPSIPWGEYRESIEYFLAVLRSDGHSGVSMCDLFVTQVPDVPIYIAIIDGPQGDGTAPATAEGFVAFMSATEVLAQRRSGRTAKDIATNLQAYSFTNREVIHFFSRLFRDVSLHGDQRLLQFLQQCQRGHYSWALVTAAVTSHDTTPTPYATLLQPQGTNPIVAAPPEAQVQ